ncbi:hypothetical protein FQA39_LY15677 [Lamprigera yunnana]|nr:hypothetical protein FQA39_LY15677 [Lamprigera yunnana]
MVIKKLHEFITTNFVVLLLAFVADNTHDSIIEDAKIVMEIYPTTNSTHDIPHENLKILATGYGNATEDVISLNNDVYNTVFVSKNNVSFSNTEEILRDNTEESQLPESSPEHFVQGNGNEDKNNEFEKTSKINILQNIIIQNNDDGLHYKADEVDANNLQHKEDCSESEDPCYLPKESSDTNKLEGEQEEEAVEIRETKGKKRKRNSAVPLNPQLQHFYNTQQVNQPTSSGVNYYLSQEQLVNPPAQNTQQISNNTHYYYSIKIMSNRTRLIVKLAKQQSLLDNTKNGGSSRPDYSKEAPVWEVLSNNAANSAYQRTEDWVADIPKPLQLTPVAGPEAEMGLEQTYTELMPVVNTENHKTEILFSNVNHETDTVAFSGIHQETEPVAYSQGNHKTGEERDSNNFETENRDDECLVTPDPEKLPKNNEDGDSHVEQLSTRSNVDQEENGFLENTDWPGEYVNATQQNQQLASVEEVEKFIHEEDADDY